MFGLGVPELIVILIIAVLIFGPKRLPEIAKNAGQAIAEFKRSADEIKNEVTNAAGIDEKSRQELKEALDMGDVRKDAEEAGRNLQKILSPEELLEKSKEGIKS